MLTELSIKNIAVIDELKLEFDKGFHIFTGETGAGKSILVEAIGLVLGEKAKVPLIRDGAEEAVVEASFDIRAIEPVKFFLQAKGLENTDNTSELIIKRQITSSGKNKIYINFQRSTLKALQDISQILIDFTGQHEQIELLDSANDITVLDSFLQGASVFPDYQKQFEKTKAIFQNLKNLKKSLLEKSDRLDWIGYQLKELSDLKISTSEEEQNLKSQREFLKNESLIREFAGDAAQSLTEGHDSALAGLLRIENRLHQKEFLQNFFQKIMPSFKEAKAVIEDMAFEIAKQSTKSRGFDRGLDLDGIEQQLFMVEKLKRKFGPELKDVLKKREELTLEKNNLENSDQALEDLKKELATELAQLKILAKKLHKEREAIAQKIEEWIAQELAELHMKGARFQINLQMADPASFENYTKRGLDQVVFLLSPNPGLGLKPLAQIASGGETSRLFLALKQVLTRYRQYGTLIFDEIDTGISGAAVELTGKKLKTLAKRFQVFCITHSAQIASLADRHFLVSKEIKQGHTFTRVKILQQDERIQEVARLMGGVKITTKNLDFARELLTKKQ